MRDFFKIGDIKHHHFTVTENDFATFMEGTVHRVCSTFSLGREMEWSSRLFVLDMIEEDEEGIGTLLEIKHLSPAFLGEKVLIIAKYESFEKGHLTCSIEASVSDRLIATGRTGQKIMRKEKINQIFTSLGK